MKVVKFVLPLLVSSLAASYVTDTKASAPGECDDFMITSQMNRYHESEEVQRLWISAGSQSKCVRMSPDLHNPVYDVLARQRSLRNQLETELRTRLDEELKNGINSSLRHRYTNFELKGGLSTTLTANHNGEILANVNGFGFYAKAKYTLKNVPSMIASAYATVKVERISVNAKYDFVKGEAYDLKVDPLHLDVDVDSRIFGISVPVLSNFINSRVEGVIRDKIEDYLNSKTNGWSKAMFSLDKAIPDDKFGSLGVSVKNRLTSLLPGKYIKMSSSVQKMDGASFYVDLSGDFSISMSNKVFQNPCYIYADTACNLFPDF
ncbi:hypothetical protein CWC22_023050 [Pseudoalteromonas rubra]|uniref:Uncharacterized protein n=1 Tax=Pseudoalteromonas rubra TaxID=43658 RepID=A0A7S7Z1D0_9GAMM|nr:hypothetical protein [Pseudoalteromonas rubra]QPB85882.1 hypothetical protein CWC22_023050 [Pseudoalteromonas rubra]